MLDALIDNISLRFIFGELVCREIATWELTAINASARKQTGQFGNGNAEKLTGEDMFDALLQVGDLRFKPLDEPFGYLAQKDTALATRVEESGIGVTEQLLRKHVDNLVGQFGRSKHFVVA
jgi:hypothetical protein